MTTHALIQPSAGPRWARCPGSVRMEALFPDIPSEASIEGTAAHWAMSEVLVGQTVAEGQITPDGVVLTGAMVEGAELVLSWVHRRMAAHGGEVPVMHVEHRVSGQSLHPDCWGTLDLRLWFPIAQVLEIADYKFGFGEVDPFEAEQLLIYTIGSVDEMVGSQIRTLRLTIIQPRAPHRDGPIRTWELPAAHLAPYRGKLAQAARATMAPDALCVVNDHCTHCTARRACPALQEAGARGADIARAATPFDLPPPALGLELLHIRQTIKALEARETGLAAQAEALLAAGTRVPFWASERVPGALAWTMPVPEVLALGEALAVPLAKPVAAITPTQARAAGLPEEMLAAFAARPPGKAKLVAVDDKDARRIFS